MSNKGLTVADAGESGTLKRILAKLSHASAAIIGPGDDCAVLGVGGDLVVTTDTMIEGADFRLEWQTPFELGWKLAATNLSDVAAMGARPTALTVALACPNETLVTALEEITAGLDAACRTLAPGCNVVGGDLSTSPVLFASVTALGDLESRAPVTRSGARSGDQVAYAGELGLAGMGLIVLFSDACDENGSASSTEVARLWSEHPEVLAAQFAPSPPIPLGIIAAETGATSMIDISDSLSLDAARIAEASDVTMNLEAGALVNHFGEQLGVAVSLEAMLTGGEDHGLLATFGGEVDLPAGFYRIGTVVPFADEAEDQPLEPPNDVGERVEADGTGGTDATDGTAATDATHATNATARLLLDGKALVPQGWDPFRVTPSSM